jgi:quercetin dioxygenase-like cupin family protein
MQVKKYRLSPHEMQVHNETRQSTRQQEHPMSMKQRSHQNLPRSSLKSMAILSLGLAGGFLISIAWANIPAPTEHKGLEVETLGVIPEDSVSRQLDLTGHKLQLRAITIMPGGQIASHSHETRPGLVKVVSGEWIEGRPTGENRYGPGDDVILEDSETVHWFFNRGAEPAKAWVCDIVPS